MIDVTDIGFIMPAWLTTLASAGYDLRKISDTKLRERVAFILRSRGIRLGPGPALLADGREM